MTRVYVGVIDDCEVFLTALCLDSYGNFSRLPSVFE
jgi:hypothetical protein